MTIALGLQNCSNTLKHTEAEVLPRVLFWIARGTKTALSLLCAWVITLGLCLSLKYLGSILKTLMACFYDWCFDTQVFKRQDPKPLANCFS